MVQKLETELQRYIGCVISRFLLWWAVAAEQSSSDDQQGSGSPANVKRCSQLSLLCLVQQGVVEVLDDDVGRPAHRDQTQHSRNDENHTGSDTDFGFGALILDAIGAFASSHGQHDTQDPNNDGNDGERTGGLKVWTEGQHGVVDFTLHLSGALHDAAHPDPFPWSLRCDDVVADESCDSPHGHSTDHNDTDPSYDGQGSAQ